MIDYEMFSKDGNLEIAKVVAKAKEKIATGKFDSAELTKEVFAELRMVRRVHEEATDTVVVENVFKELNK